MTPEVNGSVTASIGIPAGPLEEGGASTPPKRPLGEGAEVPVDDLVADQQPDDAAEREPRAEGDRPLARLGAVAGHHRDADDRAGEEGDEHRGRDGAAEEEAHD